GKTAELAATIAEEGENSPADVFFAQDPGGLGALTDRFIALPQETLERVDPRFRDPQAHWIGISGRARVVVYNQNEVDVDDLPEGLEGFTEPEWEGRLGWAPTNASFQTMVTAMRAQWGDERTRQWLQGILANNPEVYDGNTPIVAAVGSGEIDAGFVNHYYLYRFLSEEGESFLARNYFLPGGGPGALVMVAGVGILESSDNQEAALELVNYLLSEEAQQYFSEETYEYPLADDVPAQPELTPLSQLNTTEIDLADLSDLQGTLRLLREAGALP
ncbi:MAG: iron ABC transporter substrate-binding protein, partial [Anaerolineales bacterium]